MIWERDGTAPIVTCTNVIPQFGVSEAFEDWALSERQTIKSHLRTTGGVLLRGFTTILGVEAFHTLLDVMGTPMEDYIGGSTPRRRLSARTYTATELGGHYSLALHQEMSYLVESPEAIAFYCRHAAKEGGRSTLADARDIVELLPNDIVGSLEGEELQICRALPSRGSVWLASGISRPWQDVFCTEDREAVVAIAAKRGWSAAWHSDGTLQLRHSRIGAFRNHPGTGERLFFNQAHYFSADCMVRWAQRDGRTAQERYLRRLLARNDQHLNKVLTSGGNPLPPATLLAIWDVLVAAERAVEMIDGDILLLDNFRVMHGRERYGGVRSIHAGLIARLF